MSDETSSQPGPRRTRSVRRVLGLLVVIAVATLALSAWGQGAAEPAPGCTVDPADLTAEGDCDVRTSDAAKQRDPDAGLWGRTDCALPRRVGFHLERGDEAPTATGGSQRNDSYRRLRVVDGDDVYGERCELGRNESRFGTNARRESDGTFALYGEGDRALTFFSQRLRRGFDTEAPSWQTIAQMKQTQPSDDADGTPVVELQIYGGRLRLSAGGSERWTTRAPELLTWTRYALDVDYSADPERGFVRLYVDLNGDGDALDPGERSPAIEAQTLKTGETPGDPAAPLESHLRLGVYHDPVLPCPAPRGCALDIDNVQVLGPAAD